jgi:hypothetical protein
VRSAPWRDTDVTRTKSGSVPGVLVYGVVDTRSSPDHPLGDVVEMTRR